MPEPPSPVVEHEFLSVLPRVRAVVRFHLRQVRCPHRREETTSEAVALCWVWFVGLARRGRQPHTFATRLAEYAARAARSGRRACGSEPVGDVSSPACSRRKGVRLTSLSAADRLAESLHDNTRTPVPDQVQFRLDFPAWIGSLAEAKRRVLDRLLAGERTAVVAAAAGVSAARVPGAGRAPRRLCEVLRRPRLTCVFPFTTPHPPGSPRRVVLFPETPR